MTGGPEALLLGVAAHGLTGSLLDLPDRPLTDADWQRLVHDASRHRLVGHLAVATRDTLPTTATQRDEVRALHRRAMAHVLRLEQRAVELSERLSAAGIAHRLLKGPALAHLAYPQPERRLFGDVDVLVPGSRLEDTVRVLSAAGCQRRQPALNDGFAARFGKGVTLVATDGVEIDLHRTLVAGPFGLTLDLEAMFEPGTDLVLAGRSVPTLDHTRLLLHACYTNALGSGPTLLAAHRDLAQLLLDDRVEVERFLELTRRCGAAVVAADAITTTWERLRLADVVPLVAWARDYLPTRQEQRWMSAYRTGTYAALVRASMGAMSGLRERASFLRAVVMPGPDFLDDRSQSRSAWLWRGLRRSFGRPT